MSNRKWPLIEIANEGARLARQRCRLLAKQEKSARKAKGSRAPISAIKRIESKEIFFFKEQPERGNQKRKKKEKKKKKKKKKKIPTHIAEKSE